MKIEEFIKETRNFTKGGPGSGVKGHTTIRSSKGPDDFRREYEDHLDRVGGKKETKSLLSQADDYLSEHGMDYGLIFEYSAEDRIKMAREHKEKGVDLPKKSKYYSSDKLHPGPEKKGTDRIWR